MVRKEARHTSYHPNTLELYDQLSKYLHQKSLRKDNIISNQVGYVDNPKLFLFWPGR